MTGRTKTDESMLDRVAAFLKVRDENVMPHEVDDEERKASAAEIIRLLRKPTKAQLVATESIVVGHDDFSCGDGTLYLSYPDCYGAAAKTWQTMIDAELAPAETKESP